MYILEEKLALERIRIGTIASRFSEFITSKLLSGALDCPRRHEVPEDAVTVAWVPGAPEAPLITFHMTSSRCYGAIICLSAVIRGSTSHYDYVCNEVSEGIAQTSLTTGVPVMFSVLTTGSIEQAIKRAGTRTDNKSYGYTAGTIEMVSPIHELRQGTADDNLSAVPPVQNADP